MKILITGGSGFVGSNLAIFLKKKLKFCKVYSLDNLSRNGSIINNKRLKQNKIINYKINIEDFNKVNSLLSSKRITIGTILFSQQNYYLTSF